MDIYDPTDLATDECLLFSYTVFEFISSAGSDNNLKLSCNVKGEDLILIFIPVFAQDSLNNLVCATKSYLKLVTTATPTQIIWNHVLSTMHHRVHLVWGEERDVLHSSKMNNM